MTEQSGTKPISPSPLRPDRTAAGKVETHVLDAVQMIRYYYVAILTCWSFPGPAQPCRPDGSVLPLRELPEASGVAVSRRSPGMLWAHNDSGEAVVFALDV